MNIWYMWLVLVREAHPPYLPPKNVHFLNWKLKPHLARNMQRRVCDVHVLLFQMFNHESPVGS